jgi:hypothetical protein
MAAGHTPQAPDTIAPIGPSGPIPPDVARAPLGTPTSSSASLEWPQATPLKPPTRSHQSARRGPSHRTWRARPWERRRPRRHLLNGRRPHPLKPPTRSHQSARRGPSHRTWRARPWERRRPRRHLLNGRRPHPSSPRHDHPNRPLGGGRSTPADEDVGVPGELAVNQRVRI